MDQDWVGKIRRFEHVMGLIRREHERATTAPGLEGMADALRLTSAEQSYYKQLVREASTSHQQSGTMVTPFLRKDEERTLFLSCDYAVWGNEPFVLRSLLRQVFLELGSMRTLPLGQDLPFAYVSDVRSELAVAAVRPK